MVSLPSEFRAQLESYSGPLDLLLFLVKKEEVDIFDIPISRIVEQYQIYLSILQEIDPNICGEFVVMAARLMEIKSKLLLPREVLEDDEELEDPRVELVRQLLEYKKFKERAMLLEKRMAEHQRRYRRPRVDLPPGEDEYEEPLNVGGVSIWDLFTAFHRIQIMLAQREPLQLVHSERSLEEYMDDLVARLEAAPGRCVVFGDVFRDVGSRNEALGYFLALLELAKMFRLRFDQGENFGPIEVRLRPVEEVERMQRHAGLSEPADPAEVALRSGEGREAIAESLEEENPVDPDDGDGDASSDGGGELR